MIKKKLLLLFLTFNVKAMTEAHLIYKRRVCFDLILTLQPKWQLSLHYTSHALP